MLKINDINYRNTSGCVVALGCFDGVHKGHAHVINTTVQKAKELSLPSCVWSFTEPPKRFYSPSDVSLLTDEEEKETLIDELGIDIFISIKFNEEISKLSPEEFVNDILINRLNVKHIICGYDYSFGKGGRGNTTLLDKLCAENSIGFSSIPPIDLNGQAVSSSLIREYITNGSPQSATEYLGRPYAIRSTIISGQHLGSGLGFPTINQKIPEKKCVPAFGVYLTKIHIDGKTYFGITNIGNRPTVLGAGVLAETNIFNCSGNLYGKIAQIDLLEFLRPERKFSSIEELSDQVHQDIKKAKEMIIK